MPASRLAAALFLVAIVAGCSWHDPVGPTNISTTPRPPSGGQPQLDPGGPMPRTGMILTTGTPIAGGDLIRGTIVASDKQCFPEWDERGRCQQYSLAIPRDGQLTIKLTPSGFDLDAFIVPPAGDMIWAGYPAEETLPVTAGVTLEIVVIAYQFPFNFELRVTTTAE